jgi:nucleotide-binding universal stress UspA family protein
LTLDRLQRLGIIRQQFFGSVKSEICVKSGGVAESIVEYAREIEADLIMMPTRGSGPMRRFLIGSVTAKVLHDTPCPVWTSPHPRELEPFHPYRRITLAVDYRGFPTELLIRASEIAEFFHGQLTLLSALPAHRDLGDEVIQKRRKDIADELKDQIAARNVRASIHLAEGSPGEVVRQITEIEEADLIVIGRGHLEEAMGHLWTHVYEIIRNAPCPVIAL